MANERTVRIPLDVRGDIDTSMPISDRAPGVLVEARELSPRFWGAKRGNGAYTRSWEGPGTASLYGGVTLAHASSGSYGEATTYEDQFRDLGTKFTLDLYFRLEAIAYASAVNSIALYSFGCNNASIDMVIRGGAHSDHERIYVSLITSVDRTPGNFDAAVTFTGSTRIAYGTAQTDKHHIRLVRDGANATLYLDGVSDGSTSGLAATHGMWSALGTTQATCRLGGGSLGNISYVGHIYGAWLRDGAFTSQPIENRMPCSPWARNVHHAYLGRTIAYGGADHFFDAGRFGAHARIINIAASDYSITASNDDSAPAPSPVQGLRTWTTRNNRTASSVMCGGVLSTAIIS